MASLSDIQVVVLTPDGDNVSGGSGAPGGSGSPVIHGDLGDDTIIGGAANETIMGGSGADQLDGGSGDDVLYGGLGDDFLVYDFDAGGADRLFGGAGRDTLVLRFSSAYFTESRQAEIAAYLALLSAGRDPGRGGEFAFETFGLRATSIENLLLFIDGDLADPNAPPRGAARPDSFSVSEDAATLTGDVSLNDGALDGDVFSLVAFDPENGALDLGADGSFAFTLGAQFQSLAVGETASVTFTYRLTTPGGSTVATATITVIGANDAPTANDAAATTDEDTPVTIDLLDLSGAADPDASDTPMLGAVAGFALDIQARLLQLPSGAEAEGASGGVVTFDPRGAFDFLSEGETAEETIAFVVSDGNGGLVTRNLSVTITGLNDAPVAVNDAVGAPEGGAVVVELLANDFDPDANDTISLAGFDEAGSAGGVLFEDEETGELVFDAGGAFEDLGAGETRATSFSYAIVDGFGALATATLTVTVTGENDAPTGGSITGALTEDQTLTGNFILDSGASDPDASDVLRILSVDGAPLIGGAGVVTLASGATLTVAADGGFTYDPRAAFNALGPQGIAGESFTVTLTDGNGGQADVVASLTISGVNDAPVAVNDSAAVTQGGFIVVDLLANDFDPDANDAISLAGFDEAGSAGGVLFEDEETGELVFDAGAAFEDLGAGETRATNFSYTIVDGSGALATATLTVTVTGENDAPTGGSITGALTEDQTLTGNFILDSGASDPDASDVLAILAVDGAPLIGGAGVVTLASGATLTVAADGGFTYDPRAAFNALGPQGIADESFTVTVSDGNGGQADIFASLTISGLNDAPVAVNDSAATDQDSFVDINILQNDSDPDAGDSVALETFDEAGSAGGVLFANEGGGLTFNPSGDFDDLGAGETRATTFSYTIADEFGAEATATITVTVTGLNDAPQGGFLSETLTEDDTLSGSLILDGGVTDADATDVLTVIAVDGAPLVGGAGVFTLSTGATLIVSADGGFTYDPRAAFNSLSAQGVSGEFFTVTVSDGNGGEAEVLASLTILGVNDAPVAVADSVAGFSDRATFFDPLANDFDVDGPFDLLDFDVDGSAGGTLGNVEGSLRFDPGEDFLDLAPGATRTTTFTYTIADDAGAQATATITVTVTGVAMDNNPPFVGTGAFDFFLTEDEDREGDLFAEVGAFDPDPGDSIRVIDVEGLGLANGQAVLEFDLPEGLLQLTVNEDGSFFTEASGRFDGLAEGEETFVSFVVTISDNFGAEDTITATINIIGVNDAPELAPLDFTFSQNDVSGLLGLLDNSFDAEGDPLSISFFGQIDGPNVFGDFGPAAVRYDGFVNFAALEPKPLGDVNGDGFGDFFLAPGRNSGSEGGNLGGGRVILGGVANRIDADLDDGAFDGVVDLARTDLPGVLIIDTEIGTYTLGYTAAGVGDINGDGFDDFLISDHDLYAVHVVFGGPGGGAAFSPSFAPSQLDGTNGFTILGQGEIDFGRTLPMQPLGDIDGDGFADFLISAQQASPNGQSGAGSVFIVSGAGLVSAAGGAASVGIGAAVAAGGLRLDGAQAYYYGYGEGFYLSGGRLGGALAAGDVDGDGIADILIGALGEIAASGYGVTYLIFGDDAAALEAALGGTGGAATLTQASVAAAGGFAFENAGSSLAVIGDVNGDGFADLFIGVHYTDGASESYIVFGGRDSLGALDAQDGAADGRINLDRVQGEYGFVLSDLGAFGGPGSAVTAPGDVDGDGLADLLIGGYPSYDQGTSDYVGRVFLLFGGQLEALDGASVQDGAISLDEVDGTTGYLFEARGDTSFGFAIASGDFDGDGAADLLISDSRFRNESNQPVGATYLISDAGAKLAALDALDGQIDGRIDANLLSGLFIETGEPPAGAFTPLGDDAEFDPSLFAYLGEGEQETVVIEYGVSDGTDETVNTVTITITGENDAPTGSDVSFETDEDTLQAPNILEASGAFDVDANDTLFVLEFEGLPLGGGTESFEFDEGATLDVSADGTVVINADFDFMRAGEAFQYSFTFTVSDLAGETFTDNYSFTITGVNDAPVADDDAAATDQDTAIDVFVDENDNDADDDFTVVAIDAAGSSGGVLTERDLGGHVFDPNGEFDDLAEGETRETAFTYTIRDEAGAEATATLTVTVAGLNDAPTGGDASFSTDEDTDLSGDFLAASGAADVDNGDALRLTAINGQALTAGQVSVTFGSGAVLTANEDGTFSLSVAGNYESLAEGESASEAFSFTVADAAGASFTASATIAITGVNDAPVAVSDAVETDEDTAIEIDLGANDSDIDDGTLIFGFPDTTGEFGFADIVLDYNGAGDPTQALGSGDGVFVSVPAGTSLTVAFIDEVIFDGAGADLFIGEIGPGGERANIEVSSDGVNFTFIGVADNNTTTAFDLASIGFTEQLLAVRITGLDNGGSSPGFDVDFVQAVGVDVEGTRGNLTDLGGGVVNYDPAGALDFLREGETFIDLFTYSVTDAFGAASVATVEVTVTGVNDAPTGSDASFSTDEDTDLSGDFLAASAATDLDDGDTLRLTAINGQALTAGQVSVTFGSGAVLTANEDGTFSLSVAGNYEALNAGESASEAFSFTVADDFGGSFTASATISISGANDAPAAADDALTTNEDRPMFVDAIANDVDPEGGLTVTAFDATGSNGGTLSAGGFSLLRATWNPDPTGTTFAAFNTGTAFTIVFDDSLGDLPGVFDFFKETDPTQVNELIAFSGIEFASFAGDPGASRDLLLQTPGIDGVVDSSERLGNTGWVFGATGSFTFSILQPNEFVYVIGPLDPSGTDGFLFDPAGDFDDLRQGETRLTTFSYTIRDDAGQEAAATISVLVEGRNDAPTGGDASFSTDEDTDLSGDLFAASNASDVDDGDTLRLTAINGQALTAGQVSVTFGSGAVLTANEDGTFSLSVAGNYEALNAGESASEAFSFTVADDFGGSFTASATISITGVTDSSQAPVASDDSATVNEESQITVAVLNNDDAPGGGPLTTSLVAGQTFIGAVTVLANQSIQFNPAGAYDFLGVGESATETIRYLATDSSNGLSDEGLFTVTITGVNDRPTGGSITDQTDEDTALTGNVIADSGAADRDANDVLRVLDVIIGGVRTGVTGTQSFTTASGATLTISEDGTYEYSPVGAFDALATGETSAPDAFSVTLDDQTGAGLTTATVTLSITVTGVNDAPVAIDDAFATDEDTGIDIAPQANDLDAEDDFFIAEIDATGSAGGRISTGEGFVFDPNGEFDDLAEGETRETTFSYTIEDGEGARDTATITVTVTGVNDAPVANDDAATTDEDTSVSVDVLANDDDVDNGFSLAGFDTAGSAGGVFDGSVFDPNGEFDDLAAGESRTTSFSYTIRDDAGAEDGAVLTVTVTGVNDAPTGGDVFFGPLSEDAIGFGFLIASSNATDPDTGDTLSVTAVNGQPLVAGQISFTLGSGATLTVQENGEAQLGAAGFYDELDEGDTLDEVFSFTISDAAGASFTASATFRILGVNDPLIVSEATDPDPVPEGDVGVLTNVDFDLITFVTATDADEDDTPAVDPDSVSIVANAASDTTDASSFRTGGGSVVVDTANFDFLAGGEFGIFDVTFDIVSGEERVTRTITITITGEDDGPVANDDAATTDEETPISIDVLANDTPGEFGLRLVPGQEFGGQAGFDAGRLFFDPNGEFDFLAVGETATESIFYEIRDGETGLTDTAEVRITITGVNDAPVSQSGGTPGLFVEPIDEDTRFTGNMIAGTNPILDADTNDVLRVTVVDGRAVTPGGISFTGSSGAAITVAENGDISIDPRGALDFLTGSDATGEFFFYTVSDGNGGEIQGFVSLSIFGVNDAPEVTAIDIEASELDDDFEIDLFEFARDAENDTLTISDFRQVSGITAIAGQGLAGMRFEGDVDYGYAGDPAALGDINGDGIDDFIFFRRGYSEGDNERGFIVFGESPAQVTLDTADGARDAVANAGRIDAGTGLLLLSESNYGGRNLAPGLLGDINGDGFAELLISDGYAGPNNGGAVFAIFGGKEAIEAFGGTIDLGALPSGAGFRLSLGAGAYGDAFGYVLPDAPVGDVNGDGVVDLLIGSTRLNRDDAFVHFVSGGALAGAANAAGNVDVNDLVRAVDGSAYRFVGGPETGGEGTNFRDLGLATGDIDGDGINDFLISASIYNYASNGPGASYIVFGGRDALDAADLADGARDGEISVDDIGAAGGFTIVGAAFEPAVIGDVNGDGFADFAVADREFGDDGLNVFVLFGGAGNLARLDDADGARDGRLDPFRAAEERFGLTFSGLTGGEGGLQAEIVPLGDIDGDGLVDFAIANGSNRVPVTGAYAGEVHIVLTGSLDEADGVDGAVDRNINVDELYTIRATPSTTTSDTGGSFADRISSADINGDGFLDLLIGESRFFDGSRFAGGAVHVLFGGGSNRLREIDSGNDQFLLIGETLGAVTSTGSPPAGALVFDEPVSFNPSAFDFLEAGEEEVLVFEFTVSDGQAETLNTLTITVKGDEPAVGGGFGQFLSNATKPMVADETVFGLDAARSVEVPEPADARFFGSSGSERIDGTENDDVIRAGDGNDRVIAEEGRDLILGEGGDDDLRGGKGRDTIFGGAGDDTIFGQGGFDRIIGGRGEDALNGGRGDDLLRGGRDEDTVIGGVGNDTLFGGNHNDIMNGGAGADRLNGGGGADRLVGSFGVDTFVFQRGFGNDRVLDFKLFETLDFSRHDGVTGLADLTITERGADTLIEDGLGGRLVLVGIDSADLDADNFLF